MTRPCAFPAETFGWSPERTATWHPGRPPRVAIGDRVRLVTHDLVGYVVERAGPAVAVGWLSPGNPDVPYLGDARELVVDVWDLQLAPLQWPLIPEAVAS